MTGAVCLQILDGQIEENNRYFRFVLNNGRPTVTEELDEQLPCIRLSIDLFSQLYAGAVTPSRAHFLGLLEITKPEALSWFDEAMRLPRPFLLDQF